MLDDLEHLYAFMNGVTLTIHVFYFSILVPEPKKHLLSLGERFVHLIIWGANGGYQQLEGACA